VFEYDSRPIELQRAPTASGGPDLGATLAKVAVGSDSPLLVIDTGSLLSSLSRGVCPSPTTEPTAYTGTSSCWAFRTPVRLCGPRFAA